MSSSCANHNHSIFSIIAMLINCCDKNRCSKLFKLKSCCGLFQLVLLVQFGNLPYGFRANTWVVPPIAAASPAVFPVLPTEDETWGGSGGGQGRDGKQDHRKWAREFSILASMPCKTAEERQIRDRKAFLLHSLFTDVAVLKAVGAIQDLVYCHKHSNETLKDSDAILHEEQVGDLTITVRRDVADASAKLDLKFDGSQSPKMSSEDVAIRNLLKGITADESVIIHVSSYITISSSSFTR